MIKLILPVVILICLFSFGNQSLNESKKYMPYQIDSTTQINVSKKSFKKGDTLRITVTGVFATNGDCGSSVKMGLLKRNVETWDTLINIFGIHTLACGPSSWFFNHQTVLTHVFYEKTKKNKRKTPNQYYDKYLLTGVYKFSFLSDKSDQIIYSDEFSVE